MGNVSLGPIWCNNIVASLSHLLTKGNCFSCCWIRSAWYKKKRCNFNFWRQSRNRKECSYENYIQFFFYNRILNKLSSAFLKKMSAFLAHLSRRLTRWAYSIAMVRRLSAVVRRRLSSVVVVVHTFKPVYLWSQLANLDQILCVASLEWGKGCIRSWGRLDQNSGFHGNRKPPLTYNGKNDVSTFSRLFLIGSFLYLQVKRTCIKSRTSSNFHQIGPLTTELAALELLKNFP